MKPEFSRRPFISFFLLGSLVSCFTKKAGGEPMGKKAMFLRKNNEG